MLLNEEFKYYVDNQTNLVERYNGRFLVIRNQEVQGDYGSQGEAYEEAKKRFPLGTFLIQHCQAGRDNYTHMFHSRVILNRASF